ncbi:MAG: DUF3793 family protein [Ruminococcus sp.]|nr:DUF3793 family protein [Ruminococcus sp.]
MYSFTGTERLLAFHAAPTLMGKKCGSLLSLPADECDRAAFEQSIDSSKTAVCFANRGDERRLVYIYDKALLKATLSGSDVRDFLARYGYEPSWGVAECLDRLCERLTRDDFPHEVGVFLGYPLEDVRGFIKNCGQRCKLCGVWKVYGDVDKARAMFECFERCRVCLCRQVEGGVPLRLCVA